MEKGFDLRRFGLMVRWDLTTNWKSSVRMMLCVTLGLLFLYELDMYERFSGSWNEISPAQLDSWLGGMVLPTTIAFILFMMVGASLIFDCMKTRQQRTAFLMLPASSTEKFLARLLYATVGFFVMFFVASVMADVLRLVISLIFGPRMFGSVVLTGMGDFYDTITGLLTGWDERKGDFWLYTRDRTEGLWNMAMYVSFALFTQSLYILGGSFFRRHAALLSMFFVIGVWLMMGWLNVHPGAVELVLGDYLYGVVHSNRVLPFIFGALTALCYWGSYRIYRRMQVINNKWTNL
ncbi:MAG: hypothetical protein IJ355_03395 [Prevotella sp.]|nr:hypothetical protein [Prevotella sp.]